jgi:transglutaminase-like putative cysteine protease
MTDRHRKQSATMPESPPDNWQLLGVTWLLGLCLLPLLLELDIRVSGFILGVFAIQLATIRWPRLRPERGILVLLTLLGGLNVFDAYRGIAGQSPGTALLLTMMALKLLEVRGRRDLRVLLLLFGFLLVVQFLFDKSALRTAFMTLLLFCNLALLFDLNHISKPLAGRLALWMRTKRALRVAGVILLQALPLALVLFVFFPRLNAPLWDLGIKNEFAISGLQDWLEPGSVRDLVVSGENALRVRFDQPPGIPAEQLYWRGIVVWHTNGVRWIPARPGEFANAQGSRPTQVQPIGETLDYVVALEPTEQHWLISLDLPTRIPNDARMTNDFQVITAKPVDDLRFYRMTSAPNYRTQGLSLSEETAATALPDNITPRMRELVQRWQSASVTPAQTVQQALDHFNQDEFYYTLVPPELGANPMDAFLFDASGFCDAGSFALLIRRDTRSHRARLSGRGITGHYLIRQSDAHAWNEVWLDERGWVRVDPTASVDPSRVDTNTCRAWARARRFDFAFLFDAKSGFCEHYAGSFALLMRIAGIPARIVLGYLGGEFNPITGHYLIRQSDAHAWNEVWLDERGWVRVDPTASVDPSRVDTNTGLQGMGAGAPVRFRIDQQDMLGNLLYQAHLLADALNTGWRQWVVGFSRNKQQRLLDALGLGALRDYGLALIMLIAGAAIMLLLSLNLARQRRPDDPIQRAYHHFLDKLRPLGLARRVNEGPLEHRDRVISRRPDLRTPVDAIVGLYLSLRYSGNSAATDRDHFQQRVRAFRPAVRSFMGRRR